MENQWGYNDYVAYNRYPNLDGIEYKIAKHLINSKTTHADLFWKILKYDTDNALTLDAVSKADRKSLFNTGSSGDYTGKRLFITPRSEDAQGDQCSSVYIYLDEITPVNAMESVVTIAIDTCVYTMIGVVSWDYDDLLNPNSNPNEDAREDTILVPYKNRESVLLKSILAELNGLYLDGVGELSFSSFSGVNAKVDRPNQQKDKYFGHHIILTMRISGLSTNPDYGY